MAKQTQTQTQTQTNAPIVCAYCGKNIKGGTHGALCKANLAKGYTLAIRLALKGALSYASAPIGYITVAKVHTACTTASIPVPIPHLVKSIGGDGVTGTPLHAICAPIYIGGTRYVSAWLASAQGLQAMQTYNFTSAKANVWQVQYYNYLLACQSALLAGKPLPQKPALPA